MLDVNSQNQKGTAIDSLFNKDGSFDFDGAVNAATKLNDFNYQMRSSYKQAEPQKSVSQDPMAAKAQALASVKEYKNQLSESQIKPLERAYQNILQMYRSAGEEVPQGVYEALNAEYLNVEKVINDQVEKKRDELLLDLVSQSSSAAEMKALEDKSLSNFRAFADQTLPNVPNAEREKRLGELVFGYTGADGKYTRGYGADLIDALFDSAQGNKSFGSQQELRETYNNWWAKFSSDKKTWGLLLILRLVDMSLRIMQSIVMSTANRGNASLLTKNEIQIQFQGQGRFRLNRMIAPIYWINIILLGKRNM